MCFLEIIAADLIARNMGGNGQDRHTASMAVIQPVDQVQITWTATPGAYCQGSGKMRFGTSREGADLFMSHCNPSDVFARTNGVGDPIERVPRNTKNPFYAG